MADTTLDRLIDRQLTRRAFVALASAAGAAMLTSSSPATAQDAGTPKQGGTLNAAITNENATLDPLTSGFFSERVVYYNMYDSLFAIDTNLTIIPNLVASWDIS